MTSVGTLEITTERLILRKFKYSDAQDMLELWVSKPEIQHLYSEPTYTTLEEVNGLLDKYISSYENENYYRWAIIDKQDNRCIGQIAFFLVDTKNHFAEIEYCVERKEYLRYTDREGPPPAVSGPAQGEGKVHPGVGGVMPSVCPATEDL